MPEKKECKHILNNALPIEKDSFHRTMDGVYDAQLEFMKLINVNRPRGITKRTKRVEASSVAGTELKYFIQWNLAAITNEAEEIRDWTPWKPWKQYPGFDLDLEEIRLEYIDILHFALEALIMLGLDGGEILRYYYAKMDENVDRQKRGYFHGKI